MTDKPKKKSGSGLGWIAAAAVVAVGVHHFTDDAPKRQTPPVVPVAERPVSTECLEALSSADGSAAKDGRSAFDDALRQLKASMQPADAEDLAMDALLRVCTATPSGSLRSFYFGAINKMIANPFRQSLRSAQLSQRLSNNNMACPVPTTDALDMVASNEMQSMITRWLADLTSDETDLVNKHIFQELSFRQIELQDGTHSSTLYDRWAKVREKLQTQILVCNAMTNPKQLLESIQKNVAAAR